LRPQWDYCVIDLERLGEAWRTRAPEDRWNWRKSEEREEEEKEE